MAAAGKKRAPFWETKRLGDMSSREWESLCDGCGRCCLHKLEDADTGEVFYTNVACRLFDAESCRCSDYPRRTEHVDDCVVLKPDQTDEFAWLPTSCAYRRLSEGKSLEWWHPLVSGDPETVVQAGISVKGRTVAEELVDEDQVEEHIIRWVKSD
ncbi:MAG: YcgN family cysteine cluster protein [Pseudomonadota bacterium]